MAYAAEFVSGGVVYPGMSRIDDDKAEQDSEYDLIKFSDNFEEYSKKKARKFSYHTASILIMVLMVLFIYFMQCRLTKTIA